LVIAAAVFYIPANYYPVLSVVLLGAGQPSTILSGLGDKTVIFGVIIRATQSQKHRRW
jgi:uncharacterized paraquat-inducible protein A